MEMIVQEYSEEWEWMVVVMSWLLKLATWDFYRCGYRYVLAPCIWQTGWPEKYRIGGLGQIDSDNGRGMTHAHF
jgi:hypothetical protein